MSLIERAKNILFKPNTEWTTIDGEQTSTASLYTGYVIPLAAIGPIASFIGMSLIGASVPFLGQVRLPIMSSLSMALVSFAMALVMVFILALIIDALAPTFGGEKNQAQALKVAAYSYTPVWVASILYLIPMLGMLVLLASLYGLYLLYLGLPVLMKAAKDKAVAYTAVVVACAIVLSFVVGLVMSAMGGMLGGGFGGMGQNAAVSADSDNALSRLAQLGNQMSAAQESGDANAQMAAAADAMGAMLGGGEQVEPRDHRELQSILPETLAGMSRTAVSSERSGIAGFNVSKAEGNYSNDQGGELNVTISDTGGAKGLAALAAWAYVDLDEQTDSGYEKIYRSGDRVMHEEYNRDSESRYTMLIASRYLVEVSGYGVGMNTLKQSAAALDLGKLGL